MKVLISKTIEKDFELREFDDGVGLADKYEPQQSDNSTSFAAT